MSNEAWVSTRKLKRCITVAGAVRAKLATWRDVRWDRPTSACLSEIVEMSVYSDLAPEDTDTLEASAWAKALAGWAPWIRWLRPDTVTRLYRSLEQACAISPQVSTEVYTALWKYRIQALGHLRWPCDLDECVDYCRRHRLRPDRILMNTMLDGFCNGPRGGPLRPAWRNRGSAYTASDEPVEFLRVFLERMLQEWQLRPATSTLNIMMEFLSREGRTKDLIAFYDRWIDVAYALGESDTEKASVERLLPDILTFRTLFQALDPRWRPYKDHVHPRCSLEEFCVLADKFLPRLRSHLRNYREANGLSVTALETALTAEMEAHAYTGKGVEVMELLPEVVVELPRLVVVAIRGLAFNVRAVRLAQYAFAVFETHLRYDKARQKTLTPELLRSVLDALLVACDRTRNARRALDLFHSFANGEIADTAILASRVGLRALVRAHTKAPAALWPALAECLAIASAEGIQLDADAIHRLEQHYRALGPLASTARDQVQRIMTLMFDLDR
ncbi:hypothetical protein F1559_001664 [Cyanidiococcus yangmingshanensis]|uniref:Uncharacterized protein n=1 Tax=Cyanidiococcus yangmingshanensis TaxID=2690220 RepID=A0A7J7ICN0_9RHOD|nr:hypothetical protein F1559_001664 [Cyanidiococcus yangmingshanensis]